MSSTIPQSGVSWIPSFSAGVAVGLLAIIALRSWYYRVTGIEAQMSPDMAFYFAPVIAAVLLVISIPVELGMRRWVSSPTSATATFAVGAVYATALSWWAFPDHWPVVILLNPLVLRWVLGLTTSWSGLGWIK